MKIRERNYHGETSKNAYTRGIKHKDEYKKQSTDSVMWRHCQERHDVERQEFTMQVTGQYRNKDNVFDRNDAMLRQITFVIGLW